jgi:hypothetical protein
MKIASIFRAKHSLFELPDREDGGTTLLKNAG